MTEQSENLKGMLSNLESDEQSLQQRIDKKKTELDRHEKRLTSLKAVRPAFMDEYERLEVELSAQYALYVQSWGGHLRRFDIARNDELASVLVAMLSYPNSQLLPFVLTLGSTHACLAPAVTQVLANWARSPGERDCALFCKAAVTKCFAQALRGVRGVLRCAARII